MTGIVGVVGAYPHTDALLAEPVVLTNGERVTFNGFGSVAGGAGAAFARQARQLPGFDFDVSELPVVNYLSAKETVRPSPPCRCSSPGASSRTC